MIHQILNRELCINVLFSIYPLICCINIHKELKRPLPQKKEIVFNYLKYFAQCGVYIKWSCLFVDQSSWLALECSIFHNHLHLHLHRYTSIWYDFLLFHHLPASKLIQTISTHSNKRILYNTSESTLSHIQFFLVSFI